MSGKGLRRGTAEPSPAAGADRPPLELVLARHAPGTVTLEVRGDLDETTVVAFQAEIGRFFYPDRDLILDFAEDSQVSERGVIELDRLRRHHRGLAGHTVWVQSASGGVRDALEGAGLGDLLQPSAA